MNGSLLRSNYNFTPPTISNGQGATLFDEQGKNYIDGSSGAMVANLGHGNNTIAEAASEQIKKIAYAYRTQFSAEKGQGGFEQYRVGHFQGSDDDERPT
ncbi:aminotransferase class III-fold pyridoxal phosphate-dependent enzyme [Pseudomonas syringae]|uniref:aminotransferase class III-fold pyridoxal phosphate-dependent enzyme n=1 Tax=Pseudomonas syringae TaxID=317 RepID=UPI0034D5E524